MDFMKRNFAIILLMLFVFGCVGTVEDKNPKTTKTAAVDQESISFSGVVKATPISHDKVVTYFLPANGSQANLTYLIYVNNSVVPIEVKGESLSANYSGQFSYTVSNLSVNTNYAFSVGVRDSKKGTESKNNKTVYAQTFANFTADFNGISAVYPSSGLSGQTEVQVEWVPATTLGSTFSPKPLDPIGYEVRYIKADDGGPEDLNDSSNPDVKINKVPSVINASTQLSVERKRSIGGLSSGTKYFFMVRAIHKAWVDYNSDTNYKLERNEKVLDVTTVSSGGLFDWDTSSVKIATPPGEDALTKIDFKWAKATGPFYNYRVYYTKVGDPTDDLLTVEAAAPAMDGAKIDAMNGTSDYTQVDPDKTFLRVSGLESYAYYKATVVACVVSGCVDGQRLIGNDLFFRVTPELAPFSGLLEIKDPEDISKIDNPGTTDTIRVTFDAPVISAGFVNKFELYCFENLTDTSPTLLDFNVVNASGKPGCNGLKRITDTPATLSGIGAFSEIEIEYDFIEAGKTQSNQPYCFGAIPVIEGTGFTKRDVSSAVVKCKILEKRVPNLTEFKGANLSCSTGTDTLDVAWSAPTNGIFTNYQVWWRENDGTPFKYSDAVASAAGYSTIDGLSDSTLTYTIPSLVPGKSYQFGVLSYIAGATKTYSEYNTGIHNCVIPLPVPKFDQWVDIFSIGPKGDSRIAKANVTGKQEYVLETLNNYGQPIDVDVVNFEAGDYAPTTDFKDKFGNINSSTNFDGVYGKYDADTSGTELHQYSNAGIIRIAWRDVTFESETKTLWDYISANATELAAAKKDRKYGYKVLRSSDNKVSWVELTSDNFAFQTVGNAGLIYPVDYTEKPRVNAAGTTKKVAMFTDYSVKYSPSEGLIDRARVYYYKIIPVFNGTELTYERNATNPQNIIKVTLPPPNMGLVHRLMANRQTCMELGKTHETDIKNYYRCDYNGLGSKGMSAPWAIGATVYDFGADLLMDRFEMGCNYTRGDKGNADSYLPVYPNESYDFQGLAQSGQPFKGCAIRSVSSDPQDNDGETNPWTSSRNYRVGDCIGKGVAQISMGNSTCGDPTKITHYNFIFPGADFTAGLYDCTDSNSLATNYFKPYESAGVNKFVNHVAQSEYMAVFYNQSEPASGGHYTSNGIRLRGSNGDNTNANNITFKRSSGHYASKCMINIPVQDNSGTVGVGEGRIKPRWISVNHLDYLSHPADTSLNIFTNTVAEIEAMTTTMFDLNANAVPGSSYKTSYNQRFDSSTPLPRIFSSNNSKLPPLTGLSQSQSNKVCESYSVKVGTYNDTTTAFVIEGSEYKKRLMRRNEGIVASSYPKDFDETKANDIEDGTGTATTLDANGFNPSCNTYNRNVEDGQTGNLKSMVPISTLMTSNVNGTTGTRNRPSFFTGSSYIDPDGDQYATDQCTSRYGIHDLVGNVAEYSSEKIYCYFGDETLYWGQDGVIGNSITEAQFGEGSTVLYDKGAITAWVLSGTDTGRCSMVEEGSARSATYSLSGTMYPMFDIFKNFNSTMIPKENTLDNNSVSDYRNGDGFFLDFGQERLLAPLSVNDTIALDATTVVTGRNKSAGDPRESSYFNPVVGFPLTCDNSCDQSLDNKLVSTSNFVALRSLTPGDLDVSDFPVGASNILSDGMSELQHEGGYTLPSTQEGTFHYVKAVNPAQDGTHASGWRTDEENQVFTGPAGLETQRTYWRARRTADGYHMTNFAAANSTIGAGRYTASLRSIPEKTQESGVTSRNGFRCAVRINEVRY